MSRKAHRIDSNTRQRLAQDAARLMSEHGIKDYRIAKQKAASSSGVTDKYALPSNSEIEQAFMEYQRLFHSDKHPRHLKQLRETAVKAMRMLEPFQPRLVGSVQRGSAGEHSDVNLHVFTDNPESVGIHLDKHTIPYQQTEKRFRISKEHYEVYHGYSFIAGNTPIDIVVFPVDGQRQAPLSPVDGKPMQRDDINKVEYDMEHESLL